MSEIENLAQSIRTGIGLYVALIVGCIIGTVVACALVVMLGAPRQNDIRQFEREQQHLTKDY